jgi:hypothetical protein
MLLINSIDNELTSKHLKVSTKVGNRERFVRNDISKKGKRRKVI